MIVSLFLLDTKSYHFMGDLGDALQILMNVPWDLIAVIQTQLVTILMEATPVCVMLDSLEMSSIAQV